MDIEELKTIYIGKKASLFNENFFMTIKEFKQVNDMILTYFEENNYVCNIEVLKLEDGTKIIKD